MPDYQSSPGINFKEQKSTNRGAERRTRWWLKEVTVAPCDVGFSATQNTIRVDSMKKTNQKNINYYFFFQGRKPELVILI